MNQQGMNFEQAAGIAAQKTGDLNNIVNSGDGQKVKSLLEQDGDALKKAMASGDMQALKASFDKLMETPEGARLIGKIQGMIK